MKEMKLFLSYCFDDSRFVDRVFYHLNRQPKLECYCYTVENKSGDWREKLGKALDKCNFMVIFLGSRLGETQEDEITAFEAIKEGVSRSVVVIHLPNHATLPSKYFQMMRKDPIVVNKPYINNDDQMAPVCELEARNCSREITLSFTDFWTPDDGLPLGYPFDYEKDIIDAYVKGNGQLTDSELLRKGCPEKWPQVEKVLHFNKSYENPIEEEIIGKYRPDEHSIIVDARSKYHQESSSGEETSCCLVKRNLTFKEAGPRQSLVWPQRDQSILNIGLLVSGGIAPGINAVIDGIIERHILYQKKQDERKKQNEREKQNEHKKQDERDYSLKITAYRDGFSGLLRNRQVELTSDLLREYRNKGGCIIGTSRCKDLSDYKEPGKIDTTLTNIIRKLYLDQIDIFYVIGGDGTLRATHALHTKMKEMLEKNAIDREISFVAIPKTMDNDVLWVWQTFGFLSAVEKAKEFVRQLLIEAESNPRLCIVQLFGSDSGFVVSHAALASGECSAALIPEADFSMEGLFNHISSVLDKRERGNKSPYGIILVAETAIPTDVEKYIDQVDLDKNEAEAIKEFLRQGRRAQCLQSQTHDDLRSGGLKVISRVLAQKIKEMPSRYWDDYRVFTNEPRHLLRALDPSSQDIITAQRLGILAVDNAMAGYTDFMVSQWMTEYVLVPLQLVVLGRKRVPKDGIFWKSVLSTTGQDSNLV